VRRKFFEAVEESPKTVGWVILQLQLLYQVEARMRESKSSPKLRQIARLQESQALIKRLGHMLRHWEAQRRFLPQSGIGKAIRYTLSLWKELTVFLEDGLVEIDNNLVENSIRPTAVGKKNWLFIGEKMAGKTAAILYTVVESCRRHGLDPEEYLKEVLTILPTATTSMIKDLTPKAIAKAKVRASKVKAA